MGGVTTRCPCCGHSEEFARPLVDLTSNVISFRGRETRLRPKVAEMVNALAENYPAPLPLSRLIGRVWGVDEPESSESLIRLMSYEARKSMKGWPVDVRGGLDRGYRLIVG